MLYLDLNLCSHDTPLPSLLWQVPLGSMFCRMGVLPTFTLHSAGLGPGFFWRTYQLKASGMTCEVNETFSSSTLRAEGEEEAEEEGGAARHDNLSYGF